MITDRDIIELYRCLLGRDPENADTIKAFRGYYPDFDRGRRAILGSDEFAAFFTRITGRATQPGDTVSGALALALLGRATAALPAAPAVAALDADLRAGMRHLFATPAIPRFAVAIGEPADPRIDDLIPLGGKDSAILHIVPGANPVLPQLGTLADGTTIFRLGGDAASIVPFIAALGRRIDALFLLNRPGDPHWAEMLRPHFAPRMLLAIGRPTDGFDAPALSAALAATCPGEPVQSWRGLALHHLGGWLLPVTYAPPASTPAAPDPAAYPALAIAAIVRDEANCIENMLSSARGVASFYAVLDTGSADSTLSRATGFLESSGLPFAVAQKNHRDFDDDFAAMRNAALAMVPDWIEWVLMLDADEELAAEDHEKLLRLIAGGSHALYALPRYNFPGADKQGTMLSYPDRQLRLLRHTPDRRITYSGAVHETVRGPQAGQPPLDAAAMGGDRGGPHLHHLVRRFRTPEQEARKQDFYRDIARRHPPA